MTLPILPTIPTMAWDSIKRQRWNTKIQKSGSGIRKSLSRWAYAEWEIECSYTALDTDNIEKVAGFFGLVNGQYKPFLWLDPEDYQETATHIGTGSGSLASYQLLKNFGGYYVEPVYDVVAGSLTVYSNGSVVSHTLLDNGIVKVNATAGNVLTATFQYYWRVAFADDDIDWTNFWYNFYKLNKIKLVTVK